MTRTLPRCQRTGDTWPSSRPLPTSRGRRHCPAASPRSTCVTPRAASRPWSAARGDETGAAGDGNSAAPSVSNEGRVVAFVSAATNLSGEDGPGSDAFVRAGAPVQGGTHAVLGHEADQPRDGRPGHRRGRRDVSDAAIASDSTAVAFSLDAPTTSVPRIWTRPWRCSSASCLRRRSSLRRPISAATTTAGHSARRSTGLAMTRPLDTALTPPAVHTSACAWVAPASDRIIGTSSHDKICGLGGNDDDPARGRSRRRIRRPVRSGRLLRSTRPGRSPVSAAPPPGGVVGNGHAGRRHRRRPALRRMGQRPARGRLRGDVLCGRRRPRPAGRRSRQQLPLGRPGQRLDQRRQRRPRTRSTAAPGRDVARVDRFDFVRGCERVLRKRKKKAGERPATSSSGRSSSCRSARAAATRATRATPA